MAFASDYELFVSPNASRLLLVRGEIARVGPQTRMVYSLTT